MGAIVVKRATLQEIDCVTDLFDKYGIWRKQETEGHSCREALEEAIEGQGCIMLVAVRHNRGNLDYVGYASLCPEEAENGESDWGLSELFVRPEVRDRGVEQALLAAVMKYTRSQDTRTVLSDACRRNIALKPLYDGSSYAGNA